MSRLSGPRSTGEVHVNAEKKAKKRPSRFAAAVFCAAFAVSGTISAQTLAQPEEQTLERRAADYIRFREDVVAIEATPIDNPDATREAHRRLAAHESSALASGWVAYAALVAAETPAFAEAIRAETKKRANRRRGELGGVDGLISNLAQNPGYARQLEGANEAVDAVLAMTLSDGARFTALGEAFKAQAYAMQRTAWGKKRIAPSQERITEAATYGSSRTAPITPVLERTDKGGVVSPVLASASTDWSADWGSTTATVGGIPQGRGEAIIDRILNLAVRYSTDKLNSKIVQVYAKSQKSNQCLGMAKLTLDQCIAATRTPYEEAFCLGEHGLNDIAECTGWVAGG